MAQCTVCGSHLFIVTHSGKNKKKKQSYHGIILSTVENVIVEWLAISRSI